MLKLKGAKAPDFIGKDIGIIVVVATAWVVRTLK